MNSGFIFKFILLATLLLLPALPAFAEHIYVDSGCTLAQAIDEANGVAKPEGVTCEDGSDLIGSAGADVIFIPSGSSTLTLAAALPTLTSHINIQGNGVTISGNDATHIFETSTGASVSLSSMTLTNGKGDEQGGTIFHTAGSLSLTNVVVKSSSVHSVGSTRAPIHSSSNLRIHSSYFYGNSGVRANVADNNSAIYHNAGDLTIEHSVFANNLGTGTVVAVVGSSGATMTATIKNSVFFGNAGLGLSFTTIASNGPALTSHVYHVTSKNGVYFGRGTHHLRNSILYGATSDCALVDSGSLTTNENNIIGNNGCGGTPSSANPLLPDNPTTNALPHFPLPANSPAVDAAGDCSAITSTSINGMPRPQGDACDIGAYERRYDPPPPVANFSATADNNDPLFYTFDASDSTGDGISQYAWDVGDGTVITESDPTLEHLYTTGGDYTVTLSVTGSGGTSPVTSQIISVQTPLTPADASFSYQVSGRRVVFTSTSTGSNLEYSWDVDDDGNEDYNVANPEHTYGSPGTYTVTLTASNAKPSEDSVSQKVVVSAAPPPRDRRDNNRGDSDGSGSSGGSSSSDTASDDDQAPAQLIIPTCLSLPDHISVYNITHLTQCQQVDSSGIGNAAVLGLGFRDGVDVWGWVLHNTQVCFEGSSGSFRFLDAATAPRAVSELPVVGRDGMICTTINRAGTVALVNGPPVPTPTPVPPPVYSLSGCMVRTQYMLNFRASPGGEIVDILPFDIKLTALERSEGYIKVDYHGARGWISENLVEPIGTCG